MSLLTFQNEPADRNKTTFPKIIAVAGMICFTSNVFGFAAFAQPVEPDSDQRVLHILNRITYGPRPGDIQDVKKMGVEAFIKQQLNPDAMPLPESLNTYLSSNEAINSTCIDLFKKYSENAIKTVLGIKGKNMTPEQREAYKTQRKEAYGKMYTGAAEARMRRAVESPRQLEELMVDFWYNHFNVSYDKGLDHLWVGAYEQQAIRPYAMGKFKDLVDATAHHPAMLFYLDNWQNTKPDAANVGGSKKGRKRGLNENYARELMELHTLGVDGGYSQQDVIELARILSGLGLPPANPLAYMRGDVKIAGSGYVFNSALHDFGDKQFLGKTIHGTGEAEIEQAIDMLCHSPATAHHISYQLAQYFVADEPPQSLVDKLTAKFEQSGGDIKAMLDEMLHSPEFWNAKYENSKFKNPYRYVVSSLRAANVSLTDYKPALGMFTQLGMPLYRCLTPDGYKNTQVAWLSPDSLLKRIQFAAGLGTGKLPNNPLDPLNYKDVNESLHGLFTPKTLEVVASSPAPLRSSVLLGSPEFMNY
jgi:uncharacterized protein (DUF1800 family)